MKIFHKLTYDPFYIKGGVVGVEVLESGDMSDWIQQQINSLKQKVQETGKDLDRCRQEQASSLLLISS